MDTNAPPNAPLPPPPPPPPPPFRRGHRLHRDRANGILGGVCAGVAETFDVDVTIVRVVWVVAAILWIGVPAYIVAWLFLPGSYRNADGSAGFHRERRDPGALLGLVLVGIGVIIASDHIVPNGLRFHRFGAPVLLIGGGIAILLLRGRGDEDEDTPLTQPPAPGVSSTPPSTDPISPYSVTPYAVALDPSGSTETATADSPTTGTPTTEVPTTEADAAAVPPTAWTQTAPWPAPPSRRARRHERRAQRQRSFLTPITLSVLLIGAGIASLLQATGAADVNLTVLLGIGTCVVGAALVTAAFAGRAHGLIAIGILLLAATGISNTIDVPLRGGIGERSYRPVQVSELKNHYELGIGELKLDLRDVSLTGRTTTIDAETGIGHLLVFVPSSVRVEIHAHSGAGSVRIFGHEGGGWPQNDQRAIDGSGTGVLQLDLRVGAGAVEVRRFEPGGVETIIGGN